MLTNHSLYLVSRSLICHYIWRLQHFCTYVYFDLCEKIIKLKIVCLRGRYICGKCFTWHFKTVNITLYHSYTVINISNLITKYLSKYVLVTYIDKCEISYWRHSILECILRGGEKWEINDVWGLKKMMFE